MSKSAQTGKPAMPTVSRINIVALVFLPKVIHRVHTTANKIPMVFSTDTGQANQNSHKKKSQNKAHKQSSPEQSYYPNPVREHWTSNYTLEQWFSSRGMQPFVGRIAFSQESHIRYPANEIFTL